MNRNVKKKKNNIEYVHRTHMCDDKIRKYIVHTNTTALAAIAIHPNADCNILHSTYIAFNSLVVYLLLTLLQFLLFFILCIRRHRRHSSTQGVC